MPRTTRPKVHTTTRASRVGPLFRAHAADVAAEAAREWLDKHRPERDGYRHEHYTVTVAPSTPSDPYDRARGMFAARIDYVPTITWRTP